MKRPTRNVVIRYNISQNDRAGIYFYGFDRNKEAENVHIYNNTHFVRKGLDVEVFVEGRTPVNTLFENNIFYFEGKGAWGKMPPASIPLFGTISILTSSRIPLKRSPLRVIRDLSDRERWERTLI